VKLAGRIVGKVQACSVSSALGMNVMLALHAGDHCVGCIQLFCMIALHQVCTSPVSVNLLQSSEQDASGGCLLFVSRLNKQLKGSQNASTMS